eukprot:SM000133S26823  [mRNA]  locus=s133:220551:231951:- [translate_table: standard]
MMGTQRTPFWGVFDTCIYNVICNNDPDFECEPWPSVSTDAESLLKGMLRSDPAMRVTAKEEYHSSWLRQQSLHLFCAACLRSTFQLPCTAALASSTSGLLLDAMHGSWKTALTVSDKCIVPCRPPKERSAQLAAVAMIDSTDGVVTVATQSNSTRPAAVFLDSLTTKQNLASTSSSQSAPEQPITVYIPMPNLGMTTSARWSDGAAADLVLPAGTPLLAQHFSLGDELGRGKFGIVRRATSHRNGRRYACKTLDKGELGTARERQAVLQEVAILRRAGGAAPGGVVALQGVYEDPDGVHLVMELCAGGDLFSYIEARGRLAEPEAAAVLADVAATVAALHARGVVHRDLKPENILLTERPGARGRYVAKIADFGLAVVLDGTERLAEFVGSPYYAAPEVILGTHGKEADVWSLGVILYILLSGVPPFWGDSDTDIYNAICSNEPDLECEPWPSVSADAKCLLRGLLRSDPAHRLTAQQVYHNSWLRQQSLHLSCAASLRSTFQLPRMASSSGSDVEEAKAAQAASSMVEAKDETADVVTCEPNILYQLRERLQAATAALQKKLPEEVVGAECMTTLVLTRVP